jgi:hypothetical protein
MRNQGIKIILITPSSVIKLYLYVHMPLHVSVNNNHHQKSKQHLKETTITWYTIHQLGCTEFSYKLECDS